MPVELTALGAVLAIVFPSGCGSRAGRALRRLRASFGPRMAAGLAYAAVWIAVLATLRISSVAGMITVVAVAVAAVAMGFWSIAGVLIVIAVLIIWLHRANIARLMKGEEPRVGSRK